MGFPGIRRLKRLRREMQSGGRLGNRDTCLSTSVGTRGIQVRGCVVVEVHLVLLGLVQVRGLRWFEHDVMALVTHSLAVSRVTFRRVSREQ